MMSPLVRRRIIFGILLLTVIPMWPIMPVLEVLALTGKLDSWLTKHPVIARGEWGDASHRVRFAPQFKLNLSRSKVIAFLSVNEIGRKYHRFWQRK
jgi:hypothetical protein